MRRRFHLTLGRLGVRRDVEGEIRFHLEMRAREFVEAGLSPAEAARAAREAFGDVAAIEAECAEVRTRSARERRRREVMLTLAHDVRYAVRTLRRSPGFALVMIVTLALGIGANTAIFSVINGVLLRPLPYAGGDRLVHLEQPAVKAGVENGGFSPLEVADYKAQSTSLEGVVEYHSMTFILLGMDEPQRVQTGVVSAEFFDVMGVRPLLGRAFRRGEDAVGAAPVLVLSHEFWQRAFGGDPGIVGKTFTMNDRVHTVVGVLPAVPQYPDANDVYMPISACPFRARPSWADSRAARGLTVFGRAKPAASLERVRSDVATVASRLHAEYPQAYPASRGYKSTATPLREELTTRARPTLLVLVATVGFLLLLVCANVANLSLARLVRREREIALRTALGAGRGRLLRQLLTESTILSLAGGAVGLLFAVGTLGLLKGFAARFTPRAAEVSIDTTVLLFTLGVSVVVGLVLGALPSLPSRATLVAALKDGGAGASGVSRHGARGALIVSQVAVSFMLLIGAGLTLRSFFQLQRVDGGFDPENVVTARVDLNFTKYDSSYKIRNFFDPLLRKIREQPGVLAVGVSDRVPLLAGGMGQMNTDFEIEGRMVAAGQPMPRTDVHFVSPDYFRATGTPLASGRDFTADDRADAPEVAVINRAFARHHWPGENPVGKRLSADSGRTWTTIVGVVGDVRQYGLDREAGDEAYVPFAQAPLSDMRVVVRSKANPAIVARLIREAVRELDREQPVTEVQTLAEVRRESLASSRLTATLLALFAALALVITATGLAGVIAFTVSQRTQEIGVRMALGAAQGQVLGMIMRQGMTLVIVGLGLGAAGALVLGRLISGLLFEVNASDPVTYLAVATVMAAVAALACFAPARRATTIDPMNALRPT